MADTDCKHNPEADWATIKQLRAEVLALKAARDEWCIQCNMASEAQADAISNLTTARASERRLRERVEKAQYELECFSEFGNSEYLLRARKALTDDPPGQEGESNG